MAKKVYILLFVFLGLLIGPQSAMVRHVEVSKACCKSKSSQNSCCKEKKGKTTKKHQSKGAACKDCSCAAYTVDIQPPLFVTVTDNYNFFGISEETKEYFYQEIFYSDDVPAIWLPPKIS